MAFRQLGHVHCHVNLLGDASVGAANTFQSLQKIVNAARKFRGLQLIPMDDCIRISYYSNCFMPLCINIGNAEKTSCDLHLPEPDFSQEQLGLPPRSVDEFHCYGYIQKLGNEQFPAMAKEVYRVLKMRRFFVGNVNTFDGARLRFMKATEIDDPVLAAQCFDGCLSERRVREILTQAGFEVVRMDRHGPVTPDDIRLPGVGKVMFDSKRFPNICAVGRCSGENFTPKGWTAQSIYCRKHYRRATQVFWDRRQESSVVHFAAAKRRPKISSRNRRN